KQDSSLRFTEPLHDGGQTPSRSGAWDPSVSNTPMRHSDSSDFSFDESSPSPQPYGSTIRRHRATPQTRPRVEPLQPRYPGGSSGMYGSDTSYSPYQPTPSPGNYQPTPSPSGSFQQSPALDPTSPPHPHRVTSTPRRPVASTGPSSPSGYPLTPVAPSPIGFNPATRGWPTLGSQPDRVAHRRHRGQNQREPRRRRSDIQARCHQGHV
ncbi:putative transcription elongation factor SPT5 isoform X1, partial [Apostichopus japonicus]